MRLTLDSLRELVQRELDREPGQSTFESLINEAGEAWVNLFEWPYLRQRSQRLQLEAGVESYRLGLGVRSISTLYRPDTVYRPIRIVDFTTWTEQKERYLAGLTRLCDPLATVHWDTREGDDEPRLYLSVYPATNTEEVVYEYEGGWLPLDESGDVADIPGPLVQSFREFLRRYASARETDKVTVDQVLDSFMRGPQGMLARRVANEHSGQICPGPGAAGERYQRIKAQGRVGSAGYGAFSKLDYLRFR